MRHDIFELNAEGMTWGGRAWRIALLLLTIAACAADLFLWRPN